MVAPPQVFVAPGKLVLARGLGRFVLKLHAEAQIGLGDACATVLRVTRRSGVWSTS